MAGVVPLSGRTARKQWSQWILHDGPRGSLQRLRSQLAEDGCPESQVVLAKKLLDEKGDLEVDKEENAKLGVYWLTKASEQGNIEATEMLKKCLATGRGITEHNYYDVKSCLDMSQDEKLARRAAREMFTSLSNGEDFVTTEQLGRRMRKIAARRAAGGSSERTVERGPNDYIEGATEGETGKLLDRSNGSSLTENGNGSQLQRERLGDAMASRRVLEYGDVALENQGEKITEAALVSAATSYARGLLPIVSHALCLVDRSEMQLDAIPLLQRPFVHPLESLRRLYAWIIGRLGQRGLPIGKLVMASNVQTLLLLLLYSLFGTESLVLFVPIALYYFSFLVMVIATFQMLQSKRELRDFRAWSGLFLSYSGGNLNAQEAEYQFCRNNLKPYGHFFLALLANLMVYPVIAHQWTPQSELAIVAFALTLSTLAHFAWKDSSRFPDFLALFSFGVHVLAKYPYETDIVVAQTWRYLDIRVPTFASYVVGNGIEFCFNFRAVFYLLIPAVFAKMAARDNWRGTYKTLIPHCVTLSWWQIAILSSQGATWYGLIRGALALVGMVLFFPIASLASIILPIVAAAKYLSESELLVSIAVTGVIVGTPIFASWYLRKVRIGRFNWIITSVQLSFGLIAATFLSWPIINEYNQEDVTTPNYGIVPSLSWEQYQNYCHQPAWEETSSKAQVQVQCAQLEGSVISWEGYVTNVRLKSISNNLGMMLKNLPEMIGRPLLCLWGEPMEQHHCNMLDREKRKSCQATPETNLRRQPKNKCHVNGWDRYEFEIFVKMKNGIWGSNAEIVLIADHSFTNFSLNIYPGDKISFSGILSNAGLQSESLLGGSRPHVQLENVVCMACHSTNLGSFKRLRYQFTIGSVTRVLYLGIKLVLNFLFNPLVIFK